MTEGSQEFEIFVAFWLMEIIILGQGPHLLGQESSCNEKNYACIIVEVTGDPHFGVL